MRRKILSCIFGVGCGFFISAYSSSETIFLSGQCLQDNKDTSSYFQINKVSSNKLQGHLYVSEVVDEETVLVKMVASLETKKAQSFYKITCP